MTDNEAKTIKIHNCPQSLCMTCRKNLMRRQCGSHKTYLNVIQIFETFFEFIDFKKGALIVLSENKILKCFSDV